MKIQTLTYPGCLIFISLSLGRWSWIKSKSDAYFITFKKHFCWRCNFRSQWSQHLKTCVFEAMCTQAIAPQTFMPRHPDPLPRPVSRPAVSASLFFLFWTTSRTFTSEIKGGKEQLKAIAVNGQCRCSFSERSQVWFMQFLVSLPQVPLRRVCEYYETLRAQSHKQVWQQTFRLKSRKWWKF